MNFIRRRESFVVIRQVPFVLLFVAGLFSFPLLAFSFFHIIRGTDADGKIFCLILGTLLLWVFLEFVATRERIEVDLLNKKLRRDVRGVFRNKQQQVDLNDVTSIGLEIKRDSRGRPFQYLYLYGSKDKFLMNSPSKKYINHRKFGRLLSEITSIPYQA